MGFNTSSRPRWRNANRLLHACPMPCDINRRRGSSGQPGSGARGVGSGTLTQVDNPRFEARSDH